MSNLIKYNVDTPYSSGEDATLESALANLANAATAIGAVIANGTNLALLLEASVQLASFTPSATPPYLEYHLIPLLGDASTYADFFSVGPTLRGTAQMSTGASAKAITLPPLVIIPGSFKLGIVNQSGATLAGSGHKFYWRLSNYNVNG